MFQIKLYFYITGTNKRFTIMKTSTITIQKSNNVLAWQNQNIGKQVVTRIENGQELVFFEDNEHLVGIDKNWVAGTVDAHEVEAEKRQYISPADLARLIN